MKNMIPLIVAVVLGLAAVFAVSRALSKNGTRQYGKEVSVLVANGNLKRGSVMSSENFRRAVVPSAYVPKQHILGDQDASILGQTLVRDIAAGDYILWNDFGRQSSVGESVGEGEWAVPVSFENARQFAKQLKPGDEIAVVGMFEIQEEVKSTSADARAVVLAAGAYPSAGDDDIARRVDSVHVLFRRPAAAADARAVLAALGDDGAAPERWVRLRAEVHICAVTVHIQVEQTFCDIAGRPASSYARRFIATLTRHRGALHHLHAQLPLAAVFLDRRAAVSAFQSAVLADEIEISRSLFVQLDGRPLGAGTHFNIYAVNKYVRRGFVSLDEYLLIPCPCVPELIGNGRVDIVAPTVLNGYVRCPVLHVNAHVVLWYGIHRPVRCQYCCRKHGQHHAAQQQDTEYSFLHVALPPLYKLNQEQ